MAEITIIEYVITDVQQAGSYEFRLYNAEAFTNASGELIPADTSGGRFSYRKAPCVYDAEEKTITVPEIVVDSTTDSLDNQGARYSHAGIYRGNRLVRTILTDFPVPDDLGSPLTWTILKINRYAKRIFLDQGYYNKNQINSLLNELIRLFGGEITIPFLVELLSPANGAEEAGAMNLQATVADYGALTTPEQVEYFAGAESLGVSTDSENNWQLTYDTNELDDGIYEIFAVMTDSDDDTFRSPSRFIRIINGGVYQPLNAKLTQLSAIEPEEGDFLQFITGVLTAVNAAQVKTALALGNVDNTSDEDKPLSLDAMAANNVIAAAIMALDAALDAEIAETDAEIIAINAALELKADLVAGVVPTGQLPVMTRWYSYTSESVPESEFGVNGDFLLLTDTREVSQKVSDAWVSRGFLMTPTLIYLIVKAILQEGANIEIDEDDEAETLTISGEEGGGGVVGTLATATYTTGTLANNAEETGVIEIAKTFELIRTEADYPSRVRLYSAEAYLLADASRAIGDIPTGEHGVIVDNVFVSGNLQLDQMPIPSGTSAETPRTNEIAIKVQNRSGSSQIIEVTFTYIILEA